ncbi:MAG: c-type cytochrome [Isosphaeraceae bacterium]
MSDQASKRPDPAAKTPDEKAAAIPRRYAASTTSGPVKRTRSTSSTGIRVLKAIGNLTSTALIIYLTYFFTLFFSKPHPSPASLAERAKEAAKPIEEVRAEEKKLLTTYGPGNTATKTVRIPIDRAMNVLVTESNQPPPTTPAVAKAALAPAAQPPAAGPTAPKAQAAPPGAVTSPPPAVAMAAPPRAAPTIAPASSPAPAPPSAPVRPGVGTSLLFRAVCQTCHDVDGKGAIGRKAMPTIPNFTDAKWQASRSDADLQHSMLEGKGQFMLPMKDKFALARTNAPEMLAFIRAFQPGGAAASAGRPTAAPAPAPTTVAVATPPPAARSSPVSAPSSTTAPPPPAASTALAAPRGAPTSATPSASVLPLPLPATSATAGASPSGTTATASSSAASPEQVAKLRVAGEFFNANCIACHGPDGKGSTIRSAMPAIPDFTRPEWQTSRNNPQLSVSVLEGKGTLMPPWRGRVSPELAKDLVAYVRKFGPPGLVLSQTSSTEFANRIRELRRQWDEIDKMAQMLIQQ